MLKLNEPIKLTVLGAGKMGRAIAFFFAQKGLQTILYDPYQEALAAAQKEMPNVLALTFTTDLQEAVSNAAIIIESAPENIDIKRKLYKDIAPFVKPDGIVASNTSTYPLTELSLGQPFEKRMLITHFFNPADVVPLVEIVKLNHTEEGIAENVSLLLKQYGKVPVILNKDVPGFIANRLQAALLREALYLLKENVADAANIDTVVTESIGMRWALKGPFATIDYGGLDIWQKVLENLLPVLNNDTTVPAIITEKVSKNHIGARAGVGFFNYELKADGYTVNEQKNQLLRLLEMKSKW